MKYTALTPKKTISRSTVADEILHIFLLGARASYLQPANSVPDQNRAESLVNLCSRLAIAVANMSRRSFAGKRRAESEHRVKKPNIAPDYSCAGSGDGN